MKRNSWKKSWAYNNWLFCKRQVEHFARIRDAPHLEVLDFFFGQIKEAYEQPLPTLMNTDGEPLLFTKSYFKLDLKPEEALKQLLPLTLSKKPNDFLDKAKCSSSGEIDQIECPWLTKGNKKNRGFENTVMGNITIRPGKLILETNSEKRNQKGKQLLVKHLGGAIVFQQTLIESPEQMFKSMPKRAQGSLDNTNDLMALPEIQEQLQAMAKTHWQNWFDEPIPALNDKTPRQAAKSKEGRERLEALLLHYERHDLEQDKNPFKADIDYLKSELALN